MKRRAQSCFAATCLSLFAIALAGGVSNAAGDAPCPTEALRSEQHSTFLPDCRVYEMVSPPQKNGSDIAPEGRRTNAAADGNAVSFVSLAGFGDVRGTAVTVEYLARRSAEQSPGSNGWATHAITPPQDSTSVAALLDGSEPSYRLFSPDLSTAVFQAWTPLTAEPNVAGVENLYLRTGLLEPGAGAYSLLTGCPLCATPLPPMTVASPSLPIVAGASAGFSHILFESILKLTPDVPACAPEAAEGCVHLYEADHGVVRLVGILPGEVPAARSTAGVGATGSLYTPHVISADGRRVIFTVPQTAASLNGKLYQRIDGGTPDAHTVQLNASERTDCADHDPCAGTPEPDPGGPKPALYQDASTDGTRVFFTSLEKLTDEAGSGLYMYDATEPAGQRLTLLGGSSVVAVSDDGSYVYFIGSGQLQLWHDGTTTLVGKLANPSDSPELTWPVPWNTLTAREARITPDGHHLLFISRSGEGLLSAHGGIDVDQSACPDEGNGKGCRTLYLYDAETNSLQCVSCDAAGKSTASAADWIRTASGATISTPKLSHALSDDGRFVFFMTTQSLVPEDTNDKTDVYEFDSQTGTASLVSSGTEESNSYFLDASANGDDVFFTTREPLVGWDGDESADLYDAREPHPGHPAGFPEPPPRPAPCQAESCPGPAAPAPAAAAIGSTIEGPGNQATERSCAKGAKAKKVKGKVRCVKPRKHRRKPRQRKHDKRHARPDRRGSK